MNIEWVRETSIVRVDCADGRRTRRVVYLARNCLGALQEGQGRSGARDVETWCVYKCFCLFNLNQVQSRGLSSPLGPPHASSRARSTPC